MIVNNEAELMLRAQPGFHAINGIGSLGCGEDKNCGCSQSKGIGDITDRSDFGLSLCNWTPLRFTPMCSVPSTEEIIKDTSDYGGSLSPAYKQIAEDMARKAIVDDCAANPESYTEIPGSCSYSNPTLGIFLLALGGVLLARNF